VSRKVAIKVRDLAMQQIANTNCARALLNLIAISLYSQTTLYARFASQSHDSYIECARFCVRLLSL